MMCFLLSGWTFVSAQNSSSETLSQSSDTISPQEKNNPSLTDEQIISRFLSIYFQTESLLMFGVVERHFVVGLRITELFERIQKTATPNGGVNLQSSLSDGLFVLSAHKGNADPSLLKALTTASKNLPFNGGGAFIELFDADHASYEYAGIVKVPAYFNFSQENTSTHFCSYSLWDLHTYAFSIISPI